jgi:hypothetical protein
MERTPLFLRAGTVFATIISAAFALTPSSISPTSARPPLIGSPVAPVATFVEPPLDRSPFAMEQTMSASELIERWSPYIQEAAKRFKISEAWIRAVIRMESGGRTQLAEWQPITSRAGAMGLMQLMPATYLEMRTLYGLGEDPHDPRNNVLAGTAYLRLMYEKYGFPKMFAAYNAGPSTVAKARRLPTETQAYVKGVAKLLGTKLPADEPAAKPAKPAPDKVVAKLTRPDGSPITIEAASVKSIRASFPNEFVPGVQTVIFTGEREQGVREDLATVVSALQRPAPTDQTS